VQQTTFAQNEPSLTNRDPSECGPAVMVWPGRAEALRTRAYTSVSEPIRYPARDRQMILTTLREGGVKVTYIDPHKSDGSSKGKVLSRHTHGRGSVVEFWPQGSPGPRIPITQDSCVYTQDGSSRMFEGTGSKYGPYPSQPPLSIPLPLIQPPTCPSIASRGPSHHHFDLQNPAPSGLISDCSGNVLSVDPRCLSLQGDFTHGELTNNHDFFGGQFGNGDFNDLYSLFGDSVNNQPANGEPSYDYFSNGDNGGAEPGAIFNEAFGMQSLLQPDELFDWPGGYM
jgi:hypothetical protein